MSEAAPKEKVSIIQMIGFEPLVVQQRVRDFVKTHSLHKEMKFSDEFWEALNLDVSRIVEDALNRANANGRNTVKARDL